AVAPQLPQQIEIVLTSVGVVAQESDHQGAPVDDGLRAMAKAERRFTDTHHPAIRQLEHLQGRLESQPLELVAADEDDPIELCPYQSVGEGHVVSQYFRSQGRDGIDPSGMR